METTMLSCEGQVTIPNGFRTMHHWEAGLELVAIEVEGGLLLKPKVPFETSTLDEVAGCLPIQEKGRSLDDVDATMHERLRKEWRDRE